MLHAHKRFYDAIALGHGFEELREFAEGAFAVDEIGGFDDAGFDEFQGAADGARGVVKAGEQGEVGVVDQGGVQCDGGAGGAATEKVYGAAFADEVNTGFPNGRISDGFDDDVEMIFGRFADFGDKVVAVADVDDMVRTEFFGGIQSNCASSGDGDGAADFFCERDKHEANGAGAEHEDVLAGAQFHVFDAEDDAGERFDEGGVAKLCFRFQLQ